LWNSKLDLPHPADEEEPLKHFEKCILSNDKWSSITDDYEALNQRFQGTPEAMGYSLAYYVFSNSENMFLLVKFVYPGSPADEAGIQRGDIILIIDGKQITTSNYQDLLDKKAYTIGLGQLEENTIKNSGISYNLTKRIIDANPIVYSKVFEYDKVKIGYFVYAEFIAGTNDKYLGSIDTLFSRFKQQEIEELIVDLRHNPGGNLGVAGYLASSIGPREVSTQREILIRNAYNDNYTAYFKEEGENSDRFIYTFPAVNVNLDLKKVHFLTSSNSASASELLIIGLSPYMDVVQVGESTYGKCYGSWLIPDSEEPARHNYAMMPVTFKYANAQGFSDFINGLSPDYFITEDLTQALPFGNTKDPLLGRALETITGLSFKSRKAETSRLDIHAIDSKEDKLMRHVFMNR
jgi:C-terminal processing protease CtpA/Prc